VKAGQVVFVYATRTLRIARVRAAQNGRVDVEHIGGERNTYTQKRLARISDKVLPNNEALPAYQEEVLDLLGGADLAALWETLRVERTGHYTEGQLADLALPAAGAAADDAMAWALFDDGVYFKRRKDGLFALNSETVVGEKLQRIEAERRAEEEFQRMAAWLADPDGPRPDVARQALAALEQLVLFDDASREAKLGRRLIALACEDDEEPDRFLAWALLVRLGGWSPDENLALRRSGLPVRWPEGLEDQAAADAQTPPVLAGRQDLRHLATVAVDDQFTTEVDDALAIVDHGDGTRTAYVFITDAAQWVPAGSALDFEARHRISTLYIPEGKVPMLPEVLCDGVASLMAGEDRGALAFAITLDAAFEVVDFDVDEAVIRVDARITYEEADVAIGGGDHPQADCVRALSAAADALRHERILGGSITLDRRETAIHLGHDGHIHTRRYRTDDPGYRMVAEFMIQTCALAGQWCRDHDIPAIYRAQKPPNPRPDEPLLGVIPAWRRHDILRTLRKAELSTHPREHSSLGVPCYSQVSSPLRRYADLVMHRQIKGWLTHGTAPLNEEQIFDLFAEIEQMHSAHSSVEKESRRYWLIRAIEPFAGQDIEIEILREAGKRYLVELMATGLLVTWWPTRPVRLGERLHVRLEAASAREDLIKLEGA